MTNNFFIRRMRFSFVISIIITLVGLLSLAFMPVNQFPNISPPQIMVKAVYPGASSEITEKMVTNIIEEKINGIEHMLFMKSSSSNGGISSVNVTFKPGTDANMALVGVQNRVAEAQPFLPGEVRNLGVSTRKRSANTLLGINITSTNGVYDGTYLNNYASLSLKNELSRVDGVGDVVVFGSRDYSMRIWLNPDKMFTLKLTASDVVMALKQQNISVSAGNIGEGPNIKEQLIYAIQSPSLLSSAEEFNDIILKTNEDGTIINLSDVANIELGPESYNSLSKFNGDPTSFLMIYTQPGANALSVATKIKTKMQELEKKFPDNMQYHIKFDTTNFIEVSLYELIKTIIEATLLVIAVVFLFLQNWRATLIPIIAIPISLIGAFTILKILGFSINTISLFGLVLAVGLVVDDAIIVIENIDRLIAKEKLSPIEAAKKSMTQITTPVIATTLILLAVFIPVSFMPGMVGGIYREFAITISAALFISMINALTMSPVLAAVILPKDGIKHVSWLAPFNKFLHFISDKYATWLKVLFDKYWRFLLFFLIIIAVSVILESNNPKGFLPKEDMGFFITEIQLPDSASNTRTEKVLNQINEKFKQIPKVDSVITLSGLGLMSGRGFNKGTIFTILKPWEDRKDPAFSQEALMRIAQGIIYDIPEAVGFVFSFPPIPGIGQADGFSFVLKDTMERSPQALAEVATDFISLINQQPEIERAFSTWSAMEPQYQLEIDYEKANILSVSIDEVLMTLKTQFASLYVNDFTKFGKTYKVTIHSDAKYRATKNALDNYYVRSYTGNMVPLSELVTLSETIGAQSINHYNLNRSVRISGSSAPGYSTGDAINIIEKLTKNLNEDFDYEWTGQSLEEVLTKNISLILFILSLIFAYLFLVAQYESWSLPIAVLLVIPFAFFGTMLGIYCFRYFMPHLANDIYTQIGILLLIGLSAKMSILIIDFAINEHKNGKSFLDSAISAAKMRFRAVLMTSLAFIIGLLPLIFSYGAGANSRKIVGVSVCSGMLVATIFGVFFVPVVYYLIGKITDRNKKFK